MDVFSISSYKGQFKCQRLLTSVKSLDKRGVKCTSSIKWKLGLSKLYGTFEM